MDLSVITNLLNNLPDRIADVMGRRGDKGGVDLDELMASMARTQIARPRSQDVEREKSTAVPADAPDDRTRTSKADLYGATQNLFGTLGANIPGLGHFGKIAGVMGQIRTVSESVRNWYETYQQWQKDQKPPEKPKEKEEEVLTALPAGKPPEGVTPTPTNKGLPVPPNTLDFDKFGTAIKGTYSNLTNPAVGNYSSGDSNLSQQSLQEALERHKRRQVPPQTAPSTATTTGLPSPKTGQETTLWKEEPVTTLYQAPVEDDQLPPKLAKPRKRRQGTPVGANDNYPLVQTPMASSEAMLPGSASTPLMGGDRDLTGTLDELKESVDRLNETMGRLMSELSDDVFAASGGKSRKTTLEGSKSMTTLYKGGESQSVPGGREKDHGKAQELGTVLRMAAALA